MTTHSPAEEAVAADLISPRFLAGGARRHWRRVSYRFPILVMAVAAIEPDGSSSEYYFRFELTGFPGVAPEVRMWDAEANAPLAPARRPKGSLRVTEAFKSWGNDTVYRPWDRHAGAHGNWATAYPMLAWHPKRDLTFILEDLHGLLTSNLAACSNRPMA
jgi:hypothetical protein